MSYYTVFCDGRMLGAYDTLEAAKAYAKRAAEFQRPRHFTIDYRDATWESNLVQGVRASWEQKPKSPLPHSVNEEVR
jgi:hypothetical protein